MAVYSQSDISYSRKYICFRKTQKILITLKLFHFRGKYDVMYFHVEMENCEKMELHQWTTMEE